MLYVYNIIIMKNVRTMLQYLFQVKFYYIIYLIIDEWL